MKKDISKLTLREKIGQTAVMQMSWFMNKENLADFLKDNPIGNVWHNGNHAMNTANLTGVTGGVIRDSEFYRKWMLGLRDMMEIPPLIGLDPPGSGFASNYPITVVAPTVGATNSQELAYEFGKVQAQLAKAGGAAYSWSTVVDMPSRYNPVTIMRAMSDEPEKLCRLAGAMIRGLQDNGVAGTIKHFPGIDPNDCNDPHFSPMSINQSLDEWMATSGAVFKNMIDQGCYSVMVGHCAFPAVDDRKIGASYRPATISENIVTKLLKETLGFEGVVITDAVDMGALITAFPDEEDFYTELINAGNDLILNIKTYDYIDIVERAVKKGRISEERIDDACSRVLALKEKLGLFDGFEEVIMDDKLKNEISDFNRRVSERAITLECDINSMLPLDASKIKNVAIICSTHREWAFEALGFMKEEFEKRGMKVRLQRRLSDYDEIAEIDKENDLIIYAGFLMPHAPMGALSFYDEECATFFFAFTKGKEKSIGVSMGSPYVYDDFYRNSPAFVHMFSQSRESQVAFVKAIFGEIPFEGEMPYVRSDSGRR